jgi:hypothetical protein
VATRSAFDAPNLLAWFDIDRRYGDMKLTIDLLRAVMSVAEARFSIRYARCESNTRTHIEISRASSRSSSGRLKISRSKFSLKS